MKIYFIIPLNYRLTGHSENFKTKLHYFQKKLSLRYNIILKLLSLFIYVASEKTNFQKDLFFKEYSILYFIFYIIDHSACDQLLPYLK